MTEERRVCIITVINSLSPTSMPYNEFVLYRKAHMPLTQQALIVCTEAPQQPPEALQGLAVYYVGRSILRMRRALMLSLRQGEAQGCACVLHLHQPMSAMLAYFGGVLISIRKHTLFTVHSLFSAYSTKNAVLSFLCALFAQEVTFVSAAAEAEYPALIKRVKRGRARIIVNGVDLERIDALVTRKKGRRGNIPRQLVYVARMIPLKRHAFLVRLLRQVPGCTLLLVGAEDEGGKIRRLAEQEGVADRIVFTGLVPRETVFQLLCEADIYVSTSAVEGMPISVLEAMAVGLPVVLSDIESHMEIGRQCGVVVTVPFEVAAWTKALISSVDKDDAALADWGDACRACVQACFSLPAMHRAYGALYREMTR